MTPENFIAKMGLHFRLQMEDPAEQAEWISDAIEAMRGIAPNVLEAAAKTIIRDRPSPWFPTIGECRHAASIAAARLAPARPIAEQQAAWPEPTPEQREAVNEMVAEFKRAMAEKSFVPSPGTLTERSKRMQGD